MENLPPLPKVSFNHCFILFCSSACNCLKRPSTAAPTKTYSETETISSRKDYIQTLIGNQALSQLSMEVSSISFRFSDPRVDLPEPTTISKSCQRPRRNSWAWHLHCTSRTTLRFLSFLGSARSFDSRKSHLRRGGRTWYPDCNCNCAGLKILEE